MKKLLLLSLTLIFALSAVSCAAQNKTSVFSGSNFLKDTNVLYVADVDETTEYALTFEPTTSAAVNFTLGGGSYVTHLFVETIDGERYYRLDTAFNISGSYTIDGQEYPIDDEITTTARFLGIDKNLKPVYSERNVSAHSIVLDGQYKVEYYEYKVTVNYSENQAVATFEKGADSTGDFTILSGEKTYDKIFDKTYIDNEIMLFALRNIALSESTSCTFTSLDALSQTVRTLVAAVDSSTPTVVIGNDDGLNYVNDGIRVGSVQTYKLSVTNEGTFAGTPLVLYYAAPTEQKEGQRLIKMSAAMPLNCGALHYTVTKVTKTK